MPSTRPRFAKFVYDVVEPGNRWALRKSEDYKPSPEDKIDPVKRWWII